MYVIQCMYATICRIMNEQIDRFRKEASEMRVQNARLASQVCVTLCASVGIFYLPGQAESFELN